MWHKSLSYLFFLSLLASVVVVHADTIPTLRFPDDFANPLHYNGCTIRLRQRLYVTRNNNLQRFGQVTLSSQQLSTPTEVTMPGSVAYTALVTANASDQLILDDGNAALYPSPIPYLDIDGSCRTGSYIDSITGVFTVQSYGNVLTPIVPICFKGNRRPSAPVLRSNGNLRVAAFNMKYFLVEQFNSSGDFGPTNATMATRQQTKLRQALQAIDADIYGLIEVQSGQNALRVMTDSLNAAAGTVRYAYVNDGSSTYSTYTKVGYIYRSDRVEPVGSIYNNNTGRIYNRKKAQAFRLLSNNEKFIFCLNHFRSKGCGSGATGNDSDQGDGQGCYNATRISEARSVVNRISQYITAYGDSDVLIMGDLNAYTLEDPVRVFDSAGYVDQLHRFMGRAAYSYHYGSTVGCLDHALANTSMSKQIIDATVFHINADEPTWFEYDQSTWSNDMYRSSDHDAIVLALSLGASNTRVDKVESAHITTFWQGNMLHVQGAAGMRMSVCNMQGCTIAEFFLSGNDEIISTLPNMHGMLLLLFRNNSTMQVHKTVHH